MAKHDECKELRLKHNFSGNLYQKVQSSKRANVSSDFYILLHDVDMYFADEQCSRSCNVSSRGSCS